MNDLIWREDALNAINLVDAPFLPMNTNEHIAYVYAIKNLPSVDAVEVVRCNKCIHWDEDTVRRNSNDVTWWNEAVCRKYSDDIWEAWKDADWFCADGERRNDG